MLIEIAVVSSVWLWEHYLPLYKRKFPTIRRRFANIILWLSNITIFVLLFKSPDLLRTPWPTNILTCTLGFLILDFLSYWVHRAQHTIPYLWRLHAVHHSDPDLDWSTSIRHHPFEALISNGVFWFTILIICIPSSAVAAYGIVYSILAILTHANVRWPAPFERWLRPVIITLELHQTHHSIDQKESNTNFGGVLSIWDKLFGTLCLHRTHNAFGVAGLTRDNTCKLYPMLTTPWRIRG